MRPFPYHRWTKVSREQVEQRKRFARHAPWSTLPQVLEELSGLVGVGVEGTAGPLYLCAPGALRRALVDPLVAVALAPPASPPGTWALLEIDPALALTVADRCLGGEGRGLDGGTAPTDFERGVLCFLASRITARCGEGWRVGSVLTTSEAFAAALGDEGSAVWSADVAVGEAHGAARLWLSGEWLASRPADSSFAVGHAASAMGAARCSVCLDFGEASLDAATVLSLRPGDVLVPDRCFGTLSQGEPSLFAGQVRARVLGARRTTWWCTLDADTTTVERIERSEEAPVVAARRVEVNEQTDVGMAEVLEAVGDAPITLSVELARVSMTLEDLARIRPGEVLVTGVPLGEPVRLRANGAIVATGELVEVEGEVGVKLLTLPRRE